MEEDEETGYGRRRAGKEAELLRRSRDFIVVSEFSEQVGPVPVMVRPEGGGGVFNTSSFSVRIMSSDMQRALAGGSFSFSEDTQMVLSEKVDGLYAYVHYFSLYDIQARGYVRQFAISYVTPSLRKITDNFRDFLEKFSEVTRMLRCGNHKVFGEDVEHRLGDLEYTRELISQEGWTEENTEPSTLYEGFDFGKENVPERDPAVVESGIIEMKNIMECLKTEMQKEGLQRMQLYLESKRRSFQKLMTQYSPAPPLNDAVSFLAQTSQERSVNGSPQSDLSISSESSNYQPQRAMAHYVKRFERRLRDLKEISSRAYPVAMERLDFVYKYFSRSDSALEIEKEETKFLYPHSSVLTLGRVPVMNVLHEVMMSSRPHLHEPKPYLLCCKEVEPHSGRVLQAPPTGGLHYGAVVQGGFDKTFAEDSNALNKGLLYLNPAKSHQLSLSDSLATPLASFDQSHTLTSDPQSLPLITGAGEGEREGGEGGGHLGVVSSGEYNDTASGNSAGFHTPQEYCTPGNSPRTSTVESETVGAGQKPDTDHTHLMTSSSPARNSPLLNSLSPNSRQLDRLVSDQFHDRQTGQQQLSSLHDSLVLSGEREVEREMRENATFSPHEEVSSAGWGQLESSRQQEPPDAAELATPQLEVIVRQKTPPPASLGIANSVDVFSSPVRSQPPGQSLLSSVVSSRETLSPTSLFPSPDRSSRGPHIVTLPSSSPLPLLPSLDQVEGEYRYRPGRGLAQFCRDHTATRDLLYCLLQGRTLVIIGEPSQENIIRRLVRVLWMFVPGHSSSHQVIPWRQQPLTPEDISRVKLIGLCQNKSSKLQALPPHVKNYVSYWDCTPGVAKVCTPPYEGELLKPILSRTKDRKNEATLLTQIHSVLSDLAMQSYVYYHGYCIHSNRQARRMSPEAAPVWHHRVTANREEARKTRKQFLQQMGLKSNDADIIEYFVSVVQRQQLEEHFSHSHSPNGEPVRVHLNNRPCQGSFCKPKKPY